MMTITRRIFFYIFASASLALAQQNIADQIVGVADLPDASAALQAEIEANGGFLSLTPGHHRITRTLVIDLAKYPGGGVRPASGKASLIMDGPGPALRLAGSHTGTADPKSFAPATWNEASPSVEGITILGLHPKADGIELYQCVQPIISRVSIRGCRHGLHLVTRNRNVSISDCHLYGNSGVGIFLDDVNLHQINISHCHVSYNRRGGVVVRDGNVRNLQITGCDIEGNMPDDTETPADKIANILLDVSGSAEDKAKSIAEVSITGCTIQHSANYGKDREKTIAPGAANIRLLGKDIYPIDTVSISANVMSDTTVNVHLDWVADITLTGNTFFAPKTDQLHVNHGRRVVVSGNTFNPREFERPGAIRFSDSADCVIADSTITRALSPDGALILTRCDGFSLSGLNLSDSERGIVVDASRDILITGCRVARLSGGKPGIEMDRAGGGIRAEANLLP